MLKEFISELKLIRLYYIRDKCQRYCNKRIDKDGNHIITHRFLDQTDPKYRSNYKRYIEAKTAIQEELAKSAFNVQSSSPLKEG